MSPNLIGNVNLPIKSPGRDGRPTRTLTITTDPTEPFQPRTRLLKLTCAKQEYSNVVRDRQFPKDQKMTVRKQREKITCRSGAHVEA
ncbi:MAG: hypothetical protein ACFFGZ_16370 [Candidatus Thorarchaeota archaeon]